MSNVSNNCKFIIVFSDPNEQEKFMDIMNDLDIPEEFSENILSDIVKNKCDKKNLIDVLENAIFNEVWDEYNRAYGNRIHSEIVKEKLLKTVKERLNDELHIIPNCAYYSVIEYSDDDFCYEILKQLMFKLKFIYKAIIEE